MGEGDYNNATLSNQNDSYSKMDSDESHLIFFINCDGQSHKNAHKPQPFEEKGEPKRNQV